MRATNAPTSLAQTAKLSKKNVVPNHPDGQWMEERKIASEHNMKGVFSLIPDLNNRSVNNWVRSGRVRHKGGRLKAKGEVGGRGQFGTSGMLVQTWGQLQMQAGESQTMEWREQWQIGKGEGTYLHRGCMGTPRLSGGIM